MSLIARIRQAHEDLSAAYAARSHYLDERMKYRALAAEQERPQARDRYTNASVQMAAQAEVLRKEISDLTALIEELESTLAVSLQPVVLTAEQIAAVDDTAGIAR